MNDTLARTLVDYKSQNKVETSPLLQLENTVESGLTFVTHLEERRTLGMETRDRLMNPRMETIDH